ncbi:aldo/keto reductase [Consotaella aegiceratis]|uniref:aldo/keto reductase n=1 Tax=Consotaella aegiceratis TaxID=3097961 RepID=UPI002F428648
MNHVVTDIPRLGLGTFGRTGEVGIAAIQRALELGYRHIDTAQSYGTEASVREAIRRSGLAREAVFVTTKVADVNLAPADFLPSVEASLRALGTEWIDLLLIHWPRREEEVPLASYMEALAETQAKGWTRHIGVSNFTIALLERSETIVGRGALATNQVELHPYLQNRTLAAYARTKGLLLTAYMPLAQGRAADDPVLRSMAERHEVEPGTIALAWLLQNGFAAIPATSRETHLASNLMARTVRLSDAEMADIDRLDRGSRIVDPDKAPLWDE